jgi:hypothetical protein
MTAHDSKPFISSNSFLKPINCVFDKRNRDLLTVESRIQVA